MQPLAYLVYAAILASVILGVYLRGRQIGCVSLHRPEPPADFATQVSLADHQKAADYTVQSTRIAGLETIYDGAVSLLFLSVLLAPLYALASQIVEPGITRSVLCVMLYLFCRELLGLPFSLARTFGLESRFGFNKMSRGRFFLDRIKTLALEIALGVPLLYAMFAILRALPDTWWIIAYVASLTLIIVMTQLYPTVIAPLFNTFTPLPDSAMKTRLEILLARCGFEARGLFVIDASRRSTRANAYFTGFGKAKRIVFFDTLLEKHSLEEIESILAHELGHFKFGHIRQMIGLTAVIGLFGFAALGWAFGPGKIETMFGLPVDPGLALVVALIAKDPILHLLSPLLAWRSRKAEFEADQFAKSMTGVDPMVSALTKLTRDNLATLTPDPLYAAFYYSHPPAPERIANLRS